MKPKEDWTVILYESDDSATEVIDKVQKEAYNQGINDLLKSCQSYGVVLTRYVVKSKAEELYK